MISSPRSTWTTWSKSCAHEIRSSRSKQRRKKAIKRLQIVESLRKSGNRPEWMILKVSARHSARPAADGAAGWWPVCHQRPE